LDGDPLFEKKRGKKAKLRFAAEGRKDKCVGLLARYGKKG